MHATVNEYWDAERHQHEEETDFFRRKYEAERAERDGTVVLSPFARRAAEAKLQAKVLTEVAA